MSTGKGVDNTPLLSQLTVQAEPGGRSDPSNLDRDKGPNPLDMRHNLSGNIVYTTSNPSSNWFVRALAERQPDRRPPAVQQQPAGEHPVEPAISMLTVRRATVRSSSIGTRCYLPNRYNVDLRYTRWFRSTARCGPR